MYPGCEKARHSSTPSLPSTASAPASTAPPDWLFGLHQKPAEGADDLLLLRGRCRRRLHRPERPLHLRATLPLHHVCTAMKPSPSKPHGEFRRKTKNKTRAWFNFVLAPPGRGVCGRQDAHALYHGRREARGEEGGHRQIRSPALQPSAQSQRKATADWRRNPRLHSTG